MRKVVLLLGLFYFIVSVCIPLSARAIGPNTKKTVKDVYELQGRCGKSSADFFKMYGSYSEAKGFSSSYENHYNGKLNKCFIIISKKWDKNGKIDEYGISARQIELWDVQENTTYGSVIFINEIMDLCVTAHPNGHCKSEQEWDAFVKPYMEE
jgi:hypothetical protein